MSFSRLALRWFPALLMMASIFLLSSQPASRIPHLGPYDTILKKGGHALGYAFLAISYYYALPSRLQSGYRIGIAFIMAVLFALSDEFHQSFVQGRSSSLTDVFIDAAGAAFALLLGAFYPSNSSSKSVS